MIQGWRAGVDSRTGGPKAKYDFIPSSNAPPFLTNENVVGAIPPPDYNGLKVQGAYGKSWLIETNYVPAGYVAVVASGGPGSPDNPVAVRQHQNVAYQGPCGTSLVTAPTRCKIRFSLAVSGSACGIAAQRLACR